jgi:hypothetical protein
MEVVETPLPHMLGADRKQFQLGGHSVLAYGFQDATREALFDRLHDARWIAFLRFADQEMNVIRHHDIAYDHETVALADFFEDGEKQIAPPWARPPGLPVITAASDEMQLIRAVVASGMVGHQGSLLVPAKKSCDIRPRRSHLYKERKGGPARVPYLAYLSC